MKRSVIIFANGLGMALDANYFKLSEALRVVWDGSVNFTAEHKRLVTSAIYGSAPDAHPESEEQLDKLQMAIVASDFLSSFETAGVAWLNDVSREVPDAFRRYIHQVAAYFHNSELSVPEEFSAPLVDYIESTKSHVAVLNYDNLLYDALKAGRILRGYDGSLIDGFLNVGFKPSHMNRRDSKKLGWYLHLHGSPLYVGNEKLMGADRAHVSPTAACHIVLTHVRHKLSIIDSSPILREYWKRFSEALEEVDQVILFGYSGEDTHLNQKLASAACDKKFHIVEWSGAGTVDNRKNFWNAKLPSCDVNLIPLDGILDFTGWAAL